MGQFYHVILDPHGNAVKYPLVYDFKEIFAKSADEIGLFNQIMDRSLTEQTSPLSDDGAVIVKRINPAPSTGYLSFHLRNERPENVLAFTLLISGRKLDADEALASMFQQMISATCLSGGIEAGRTLVTLKYRPLCVTIFGAGIAAPENRNEAKRITKLQVPFAAAFFKMRGII